MSRRNTESDRILESGSFSRTIGFSRVGEEKRMLLETLRNEFHRTNLVNDARNRWMSHVDIQFTNIRITGKINSRRREGREKGGRGLLPIERGFSNLSDWLRADRGASHYKNEISFVAGRVDGNRRQDDDTAPRSREDGSPK